MLWLAKDGDVPPEANQTVGQEAIGLARRALETHTQLHGLEHSGVANGMSLLADALEYFNNIDDDEVLRLYEQSIAIQARVEGSMSVNIAQGEYNLANVYDKRADRANAANDLDREKANLEQALSHFREAARIDRFINNLYAEYADHTQQRVAAIEEKLERCRTEIAAANVPGTRG